MLVVSHKSVGVVAFSLRAAFERHLEHHLCKDRGCGRGSFGCQATTAAWSTLYQTQADARARVRVATRTRNHVHVSAACARQSERQSERAYMYSGGAPAGAESRVCCAYRVSVCAFASCSAASIVWERFITITKG